MMPASVRPAAHRSRPSTRAERKLATIVFADLVGSTELASSLDPEELRRRLTPFFEVARSALAEHGGTVEKYVGDAVMAVFGVPRPTATTPIAPWPRRSSLSHRVSSLAERAVGQGRGRDGRGALHSTARRSLGHRRGGERRRPPPAGGSSPARSWSASAPRGPAGPRGSRSESRSRRRASRRHSPPGGRSIAPPDEGETAAARGAATPLIGREDDLALLELVYRRAARDRAPQLVTITGDAGVGKTRLATELFGALGSAEPRPQDPGRTKSGLRPRDRLLGARRDRAGRRRRGRRRLGRSGPPGARDRASPSSAPPTPTPSRRPSRRRSAARRPRGTSRTSCKHAWRRLVAPARRGPPAGDRDRRRALGRRWPPRSDRGGRLPPQRRPADGRLHEPARAPRASIGLRSRGAERDPDRAAAPDP